MACSSKALDKRTGSLRFLQNRQAGQGKEEETGILLFQREKEIEEPDQNEA